MGRYCGDSRVFGATYLATLEEKLKKLGQPLQLYVQCPPIPIPDFAGMGGSTQGQSYICVGYDQDGKPVYAVFDWVGSDYPSPADFVEEFFKMGLSLRMPMNKANPQSYVNTLKHFKDAKMLYIVHPKAIIDDQSLKAYHADRKLVLGHRCILQKKDHEDKNFQGMCSSLWWEDIPSDRHNQVAYKNVGIWKGPRLVKRSGGSTEFTAALTPKGVKPTYTPGIILAVPIAAFGLEVIYDPMADAHQEALDIIASAGVDVPVKVCYE